MTDLLNSYEQFIETSKYESASNKMDLASKSFNDKINCNLGRKQQNSNTCAGIRQFRQLYKTAITLMNVSFAQIQKSIDISRITIICARPSSIQPGRAARQSYLVNLKLLYELGCKLKTYPIQPAEMRVVVIAKYEKQYRS